MWKPSQLWRHVSRIPKRVTLTEIDMELLRAMRSALDFWLTPGVPRKLRLVTAVRICQIEMRISELAGSPLPDDGHFGCERNADGSWATNESKPKIKRMARMLGASVIAVRAALAWRRRAERSPRDMSFYDQPIFGAAGFRPLGYMER